MRNEVLASQSLAAADAWYAAHTGIGSVDIVTDLPDGHTDPGPLAVEDLTPGSLTSSYDGQVIIGVRGSNIRVEHNNVTYLRCLNEGTTGTYGSSYSPTTGSALGGTRIEACTLAYPHLDGAAEYVAKDPCYWAQEGLPDGADYSTTMRRCDINGWAGGVQGFNLLLEYNWHHGMQYPDGYHANQVRLRRDGGRAWRNYGVGGSSGIMSLYFDKEPTRNLAYEQNFLNGEVLNGLPRPNYLVNMKNGDYVAAATGIVVADNYFGPIKSSANMTTEALSWGSNGNVLGPNHDIASGTTF